MNFLVFLSTYILPFFIFYVVAYGLWKGRNVYQAFVEGAKGGFHTALGILPTLVGLLAAVGVLRASGFLFDGVHGGLRWTGSRQRSYYVSPPERKRRWIKKNPKIQR